MNLLIIATNQLFSVASCFKGFLLLARRATAAVHDMVIVRGYNITPFSFFLILEQHFSFLHRSIIVLFFIFLKLAFWTFIFR